MHTYTTVYDLYASIERPHVYDNLLIQHASSVNMITATSPVDCPQSGLDGEDIKVKVMSDGMCSTGGGSASTSAFDGEVDFPIDAETNGDCVFNMYCRLTSDFSLYGCYIQATNGYCPFCKYDLAKAKLLDNMGMGHGGGHGHM
jgi:hypothetical protein